MARASPAVAISATPTKPRNPQPRASGYSRSTTNPAAQASRTPDERGTLAEPAHRPEAPPTTPTRPPRHLAVRPARTDAANFSPALGRQRNATPTRTAALASNATRTCPGERRPSDPRALRLGAGPPCGTCPMSSREITPYADPRWRRVRRIVLDRDRETCQIRLGRCRYHANHVDHIIDWRDGGAWFDPLNLRAACGSCNVAQRNARVAARARAQRARPDHSAAPPVDPGPPPGW